MARQLVVLALIFVAMSSMVMANEAPSPSPKSSPSPSSSPSSSSSPSPKASSPSASSPSTSPASSPSEEGDVSSPPAPGSDPMELFAPGPAPAADDLTPEAEPVPADETSGATALRVSAITAAAVAGFFAF